MGIYRRPFRRLNEFDEFFDEIRDRLEDLPLLKSFKGIPQEFAVIMTRNDRNSKYTIVSEIIDVLNTHYRAKRLSQRDFSRRMIKLLSKDASSLTLDDICDILS